MIDKTKIINSEWRTVDNYLKKDSSEGLRLAVIESENVFLKIVEGKGYKTKNSEEKIALAIKELSRPEVFLRNREKALLIKNKVGAEMEDAYSSREMVDIYKEAVEEILFGIIEEKKFESLKARFWRFYYPLYLNRKKVYRFLSWAAVIILLMLFIADTDLGQGIFSSVIDKINLIIRVMLFILFIAFSIVFFITLVIVLLESRSNRRYSERNRPVEK